MKVWPSKDPDEALKYGYDWTPDLPDGVTLDHNGSTFTPVVAAGTTTSDEITSDTEFTAVILGGNDGEEAQYTLRVTLSDGQILEDTIALPIVASTTLMPVPYPGGYADPTGANLLAVFPEFSNVSPALLDYYLRRAARSVDASWPVEDFGDARMLLAAHLMTMTGLGSTAEAKAVANGSGQFKVMAIGSLRLERFDASKDTMGLMGTRYGLQFAQLRRANRSGPRVTGRAFGGLFADGDKAW
jgi:hypothetical protein